MLPRPVEALEEHLEGRRLRQRHPVRCGARGHLSGEHRKERPAVGAERRQLRRLRVEAFHHVVPGERPDPVPARANDGETLGRVESEPLISRRGVGVILESVGENGDRQRRAAPFRVEDEVGPRRHRDALFRAQVHLWLDEPAPGGALQEPARLPFHHGLEELHGVVADLAPPEGLHEPRFQLALEERPERNRRDLLHPLDPPPLSENRPEDVDRLPPRRAELVVPPAVREEAAVAAVLRRVVLARAGGQDVQRLLQDVEDAVLVPHQLVEVARSPGHPVVEDEEPLPHPRAFHRLAGDRRQEVPRVAPEVLPQAEVESRHERLHLPLDVERRHGEEDPDSLRHELPVEELRVEGRQGIGGRGRARRRPEAAVERVVYGDLLAVRPPLPDPLHLPARLADDEPRVLEVLPGDPERRLARLALPEVHLAERELPEELEAERYPVDRQRIGRLHVGRRCHHEHVPLEELRLAVVALVVRAALLVVLR